MIEMGAPERLTAAFSREGSLLALRSAGIERSFVQPAAGFSVTVLRGDSRLVLRPQARGARGEVDEGRAVTFSFREAASDSGESLPLRLSVRWWIDDRLLHATCRIERLPEGLVLDCISIPDVTVEYAGEVSIVLPVDSGVVIERAQRYLLEGEGDAKALENLRLHMPFAGWEEGGCGLYLDSRDADGWIKRWCFSAAGAGRARIQTQHKAPRPDRPLEAFTLPYPVSLTTYGGGWYECASIYRSWAKGQSWAARGPSLRRGSYIGELSCWLWNRGAADIVVPPTNELSRRIGHPVVLDWYWWHRHPYDTGYPEYYPPREGEARFRAAVKELHDHGNYVQVYTNGMSWDEELPSWKTEGRACTLVKEDGQYWGVVYNTWMNRRLMHTCGASERWHRTVLENVRKGRKLGLDGIYIDQIATVGGTVPCFSAEHGHVPGGGAYGIEGWRRLLAEVRRRFPGFVISSEATRENFHDLLEANIILSTSAERMPGGPAKPGTRPVPLCSAVHHGAAVFFGNYAIVDGIPPFDPLWPAEARPDPARERDWHSLCPDQFALEIARTVCFGMQPTVANLTMRHLEEQRFAADVAYLVDLCRLYHEHREHLLWGDMLSPGALACPEHDVDCLERFVFTDPRKAVIQPFRHPMVLHSEWQDGEGRARAFLFNYSRSDVEVEYGAPAGFRVVGSPLDAAGAPSAPSGAGWRATIKARSTAVLDLARE